MNTPLYQFTHETAQNHARRLTAFREWYMDCHVFEPELYPLYLPEETWAQMFEYFEIEPKTSAREH